jgi:indole-3-glycerol phosphate synthase
MSTSRPDILNRILARKQQEIEARQRSAPLKSLQQKAVDASPPRGFVAALKQSVGRGEPAVIAEIKKASPSKGVIREDFDVVEIARSYSAGGASCLSVLTDRDFFQGHEDFLVAARSYLSLPHSTMRPWLTCTGMRRQWAWMCWSRCMIAMNWSVPSTSTSN